MDIVGLAVVDLVRGHQTEPDMVVLLAQEEPAAELPGIYDATEEFGKLRLSTSGS